MVFAGSAQALLHLYRKSLPKLYDQMISMKQLLISPGGIEKLNGQFTGLPSYGFSRTILEPNANTFVLFARKVLLGVIGKSNRVASELSNMAIETQ